MTPDAFEQGNLRVFRELYPAGNDYVVEPCVAGRYPLRRGTRVFTVCGVQHSRAPRRRRTK